MMGKIMEVLKNQLDVEIKSAEEKLTSGNLDAIYKLTCAISNLCDMEHGETKETETAESTVKKYSNGRYDHNIDSLYDAYIAAKKQYKEVGDSGHRDKLMECIGRLMTEVYDMVSQAYLDCDTMDERKLIQRQIQMMANM
jgi:hypothetical protein